MLFTSLSGDGGRFQPAGSRRCIVKYGLGWLIGIPIPILLLWFFANQAGCGF